MRRQLQHGVHEHQRSVRCASRFIENLTRDVGAVRGQTQGIQEFARDASGEILSAADQGCGRTEEGGFLRIDTRGFQ
jgi:hypothetical protein